MSELSTVLLRFQDVSGSGPVVWTRARSGALVPEFGRTDLHASPVVDLLRVGLPPAEVELPQGRALVAAVPGRMEAWLGLLLPPSCSTAVGAQQLEFLLPVVAHYFQARVDSEHAAFELAERYEEINLLYTTSEILGRTVSLEEAAARILHEISETVNARRASILVHDRVTDTLQVVSASGFEPLEMAPIASTDAESIAALAFREHRAQIVDVGERECSQEQALRVGGLLAVPILWTNPGHQASIPLGVVTLSDRRNAEPFRDSDEKLVSAIATQIGTAIQNARLVRAQLAQQKLQHEMQLASDLQMKLLPDTALFAPEIHVAARVMPADSVGGDFYHLFRLSGGRTGVMIGDVSSHGYRAALVMALVMSAASIHAQGNDDPGSMLDALLSTLREELESTEMFITLFYVVLDPARGTLQYANAGHPHAFVLAQDGATERLAALDPPLGMSVEKAATRTRSWRSGKDVLLLFTDGLSDARNRHDQRLGEEPVLNLVRELRYDDPALIVERTIAMVRAHAKDAAQRDDISLLIAKS